MTDTPTQEQIDERRVRTREMVDKLVQGRTEMLSLFCRVAGLEPFTADGPIRDELARFCQVLVDYMAAGHFTLYERILDRRERRQRLVDLADNLYPRIAEISDEAVRFNDKYSAGEFGEAQLEALSQDLSRLGESLASRIEMEDRLIRMLY